MSSNIDKAISICIQPVNLYYEYSLLGERSSFSKLQCQETISSLCGQQLEVGSQANTRTEREGFTLRRGLSF